MLHPITDQAAASARLVIAGHSRHTQQAQPHQTCTCAGCVEDARLLMQACGLVDDPLAGNIMITRNGSRKKRAAYR